MPTLCVGNLIGHKYLSTLVQVLIFTTILLWYANSQGEVWNTVLPMYFNWIVDLWFRTFYSTITVNTLSTLSPLIMKISQISSTQQMQSYKNNVQKGKIILSRYLLITCNTKSMIVTLLIITRSRLIITTLMSSTLQVIIILAGCVWLHL